MDDFRLRTGVPLRRGLGPLSLDAGLGGERWAKYEFGGAPLGNRRLSRQLVVSAAAQAESPGRAFCGRERGSNAMIKGHYRFIEQPEAGDSAVTAENSCCRVASKPCGACRRIRRSCALKMAPI